MAGLLEVDGLRARALGGAAGAVWAAGAAQARRGRTSAAPSAPPAASTPRRGERPTPFRRRTRRVYLPAGTASLATHGAADTTAAPLRPLPHSHSPPPTPRTASLPRTTAHAARSRRCSGRLRADAGRGPSQGLVHDAVKPGGFPRPARRAVGAGTDGGAGRPLRPPVVDRVGRGEGGPDRPAEGLGGPEEAPRRLAVRRRRRPPPARPGPRPRGACCLAPGPG